MKITRLEFERIRNLKQIDLQQCSFCQRITILNLGWPAFGEFYCRLHEANYILCPELCYQVCLNIWRCQLYREVETTKPPELVKPNKPYDKCVCYCCGKELAGASKKGVVKNRNNPSFWGINSEYKILCLRCVGRKYLQQLAPSKRKTFQKYLKRGYV